MAGEVVEFLGVKTTGVFIDGTLGGGGHAFALLSALPRASLIGLDKDPEALSASSERLKGFGSRVRMAEEGFENIPEVMERMDVGEAAGVLLDLGVSSRQIDAAERGFSFSRTGPLSMAFSARAGKTAQDVLNGYSEERLAGILREYGEERRAGRIARAIIRARQGKGLLTTSDLAAAVDSVCPSDIKAKARVFQAIRIEVNEELKALKTALERIPGVLAPGGRLAVISYHSLEDRAVKQAFRAQTEEVDRGDYLLPGERRVRKAARLVTKKAVTPSEKEKAGNTRSRSAKLRVMEKI